MREWEESHEWPLYPVHTAVMCASCHAHTCLQAASVSLVLCFFFLSRWILFKLCVHTVWVHPWHHSASCLVNWWESCSSWASPFARSPALVFIWLVDTLTDLFIVCFLFFLNFFFIELSCWFCSHQILTYSIGNSVTTVSASVCSSATCWGVLFHWRPGDVIQRLNSWKGNNKNDQPVLTWPEPGENTTTMRNLGPYSTCTERHQPFVYLHSR